MAKPNKPRAKQIKRNGKILRVWIARQRTKQPDGSYKAKEKQFDSYAEAQTQILAWQAGTDRTGAHTFAELAAYFNEHYAIPAQYSGGRKIAGYKTELRTIKQYINEFEQIFTTQDLTKITYEQIRAYSQSITGRGLSIAAANRRLSLLRYIFNVAIQLQWLDVNPFARGRALIRPSLENVRTRTITEDEESKILAACVADRIHLKPIFLLALDTGMRRGEILSLTWQQIDFENRVIYLTGQSALNTKSGKPGVLPLTDRAFNALKEWQIIHKSKTQIFPFADIQRSWATACRIAGVKDLQFRDLRTSAATNWARAGFSLDLITKILRNSETVARRNYLQPDLTAAQTIGAAMDRKHAEIEINAVQ